MHPQMTSWASALMTVMDFHLSIDSDHVPDLMSGMAGHPGVWWSSTDFPDGVSGHAYIIIFPVRPQVKAWRCALMPVMAFHMSIDSEHVPDLLSGMAGHPGVCWSSTEFPDWVSGHAYII